MPTLVPGQTAVHRIITKSCRHRPRHLMLEDLKTSVADTITRCDDNWPKDSNVKFHVVITVESP